MERNLTTGSVWKSVLYFSVPFFLAYFLQTLYGMADLFIIGQFYGVDSTTAVSIGSQVMHMLTVMIVGLAMGGTVLIGQAIGAEDPAQLSRATGNTITLFLALSVVLSAVLFLSAEAIVAMISTPAEAVPGAIDYLRICFLGIPFITAYNITSSIFRGMGDSKSPMYFVAVACAANIVLDYLFIGVMQMGPAGAALGTTLSQSISVFVSVWVIRTRNMGICLKKEDLTPDRATMKSILKIGVPIALQDGFIQVAFIVITIFANLRGLNDAAAVGIVEKVIGILFLVPSSMLQSVSALAAQNIGARKHDRARRVLYYATAICLTWGFAATLVMQFQAERFIHLFTADETVVRMGGEYMRGYVWDCILAGIHFCFSGYFCAYGLSNISFIHNSLSILLVRVPIAYWASHYCLDSLLPMGLASPAGSALSAMICICAYIWLQRKKTAAMFHKE